MEGFFHQSISSSSLVNKQIEYLSRDTLIGWNIMTGNDENHNSLWKYMYICCCNTAIRTANRRRPVPYVYLWKSLGDRWLTLVSAHAYCFHFDNSLLICFPWQLSATLIKDHGDHFFNKYYLSIEFLILSSILWTGWFDKLCTAGWFIGSSTTSERKYSIHIFIFCEISILLF